MSSDGGGEALRDSWVASFADRELMLDRKGIPFKRVDLMPVISKGVLRAQRLPRSDRARR